MKKIHIKYICSLALYAIASTALAAEFPNKPIILVAPYSAGGNADSTARLIAERLSEKSGKPVIVENRPGAGTMLAAEHVANAAPDGYTLLLTGSSVMVAPTLNKNDRYDPQKSFEPIAGVGFAQHILVVPSKSPVHSVKELVNMLAKEPGKHSYASVGMGATNHLEMELLQSMTGTKMIHVPYKGSSPALVDLLSGRIDMMFDAYSSSKPYIDAGKLRVLGVSSAERAKSMPDFPSVAEMGIPGFNAVPWLGIAAPAKTPKVVADKLNFWIREIIAEPTTNQKLINFGMDPMLMDRVEFSKFTDSNIRMWLKIIEDAKIEIDK